MAASRCPFRVINPGVGQEHAGAGSHVNELLWRPVLIDKICRPWLLTTNEIQEERISHSLLAMGSVCRGLKTPKISQDRGIFPWLSAYTLVSIRSRSMRRTLHSTAVRLVICRAQDWGNQPLSPSRSLSPQHQPRRRRGGGQARRKGTAPGTRVEAEGCTVEVPATGIQGNPCRGGGF